MGVTVHDEVGHHLGVELVEEVEEFAYSLNNI
jgi:hypothetical protein